MSPDDVIAATFLLPSSSAAPLVVELPHHALRLVVVTNVSVSLLDDSWDTSGIYILLGPGSDASDYTAYVGKAPSGLRSRVREHVRSREGWNRALLVAHTSYGFSSGAVGWLEGALWDVLDRAPAAQLTNRQRPRDETLPPWERRELERYLSPVTAVLRALGASPDTPDQRPPRGRRRPRRYSETLSDLVAGGLLKPGTRVRPLPDAHDTPAEVQDDGRLAIGPEVYESPSAAAAAVCGHHVNGWDFWAAPSGDGTLASLSQLRARLRDGTPSRDEEGDPQLAPTPSPLPAAAEHQRGRSGATSRRTPRKLSGSIGELVRQGLVPDGRIHASYKGTRYDAVISSDGAIRLEDGTSHTSLSQAAVHITGIPTNGWTFWKTLREGRTVTLGSLRSQLR